MKKYYDILGLKGGDDAKEIEKKYKLLSKEFGGDNLDDDLKDFFKKEYDKVQESYKVIMISIEKEGQNNKKTEEHTEKLEEEITKLKEEVNLLKDTYHILVNNTGGPAAGPIADANTQSFEDAFRMHLINNQILVQKVVEGMKKEGFGRIVNIISTSVKAPIPGLGVSNTIRAAVANWAKTLSIEIGAYGITVNNVLPGFTDTNRLKTLITKKASVQGKTEEEIANTMKSSVPANRFGQAYETANAVAFLCSPAASYINGINLPVDGGRTASL